MKLSKENPQEPGYYWVKYHNESRDYEPTVVQVSDCSDVNCPPLLGIFWIGNDIPMYIEKFVANFTVDWWCGPIPLPIDIEKPGPVKVVCVPKELVIIDPISAYMSKKIRIESLLAKKESILTTVKGMEAENTYRLMCGNSVAYGYDEFSQSSIDLEKISDEIAKIIEKVG